MLPHFVAHHSHNSGFDRTKPQIGIIITMSFDFAAACATIDSSNDAVCTLKAVS